MVTDLVSSGSQFDDYSVFGSTLNGLVFYAFGYRYEMTEDGLVCEEPAQASEENPCLFDHREMSPHSRRSG